MRAPARKTATGPRARSATLAFVLAALVGPSVAHAQSVAIVAGEDACPSRHAVQAELSSLRPGVVFADRDARVRATIVDLGDRYRVTLLEDKLVPDPLRRCEERARTSALVIALAYDEAGATMPRGGVASHENTKSACGDHIDNDEDGRVDCDDPECGDLAICTAPTAPVAPPGDAGRETKRRSMRKVAIGSLLVGLGAGLTLGSAGTWVAYDDAAGRCDHCTAKTGFLGVSIAFDLAGVGLMTGGALLAAQGAHGRITASQLYTPFGWMP